MALVLQAEGFTPIVNYFVSLFEFRKEELGFTEIWYGDQSLISSTPSVAVEASSYTRELSGIGGKGRTDNVVRIYFLIYISKIQNISESRKEADEYSEKVMDVLHEDVTLGGLVIHGHVTSIEPGYTQRGNALFRSARVTWEGLTKTLIK